MSVDPPNEQSSQTPPPILEPKRRVGPVAIIVLLCVSGIAGLFAFFCTCTFSVFVLDLNGLGEDGLRLLVVGFGCAGLLASVAVFFGLRRFL